MKKILITENEIESIKSIADDISSMIGGGDEESDFIWKKHIRYIDRFLKRNGHKRSFK